MRPAPSSRRTASLLAAAIGLTAAVLSVPGAASAAPAWDVEYTADENALLPVPDTACGATWEVTGAAGGDSAAAAGGLGALVTATTSVPTGGSLLVQPGRRGASGEDGGTGGASGAESSGGSGGAGAGGGGGASVVRDGNSPTMGVLVLAGGGGGAGSRADGGDAGTAGDTWTAPGGAYTGGTPGTLDGPGAGGAVPPAGTGTAGAAGNGQIGADGPVGAGGGGGSGRGNGSGGHAGGSGSSDGTDGSGGGGGASTEAADGITVTTAATPDGSVRATWVPCTVPAWHGFVGGGSADDGRLWVEFVAVTHHSVDPDAAVATGWEVSLDDGATWTAATAEPAGRLPGAGPGLARLGIAVDGLTNGRSYPVRVRATSLVGPGETSPALTLTPQAPVVAAPVAPVVPAVAPPAAAAVPATVPPADGPLTGVGASGTPGRPVTVSGSGYLPGSPVDLYVYSTPQLLGTVTADAQGAFTATVTLPAGLVPGTHHLVAAGVDPSGNPRYLVTQVRITAGSAPSALANTGVEPLPWGTGAGVLLLAGGVLVALGRRRSS